MSSVVSVLISVTTGPMADRRWRVFLLGDPPIPSLQIKGGKFGSRQGWVSVADYSEGTFTMLEGEGLLMGYELEAAEKEAERLLKDLDSQRNPGSRLTRLRPKKKPRKR